MQKKLLAVAVLSAFSGLAAAQSANVTLYGTIVQNVEQVSVTGGDNSVIGTSVSSARGGTSVGGARVTGAVNAAGATDQGNRFRFNPAGTNFGLRGSEDLGNGLAAWFQLELAVQIGNSPPNAGTNHGTAASYRNTAVGLRSNTWGTVLFGMWDTPFNVMVGNTNANGRIGGASQGHHANLLGGNAFAQGAVSGQATAAWCTPVAGLNGGPAGGGSTAANCANFGMNFDRRERSSIQWWSPNWNGFEVRGAYNVTADTGGITVDSQVGGLNALKQNIWDLSLAYSNGPLYLGYAYERQNDTMAAAARTFIAGGINAGEATGGWSMGNATGTSAAAGAIPAGAAGTAQGVGDSYMSGSKGTGHRLGGKYTFDLGGSSSIGLGAMWESLKWDFTYGVRAGAAATASQNLTGLKKTAWRLQGNYTFGSHFIGLDYVRANAMSGSIQSATAVASNTFDGSGTSSRAWQLAYNYMLSKRTSIGAYYNTVRNDTNANYTGIVFGGITGVAPGSSPKYLGMQVRHSF